MPAKPGTGMSSLTSGPYSFDAGEAGFFDGTTARHGDHRNFPDDDSSSLIASDPPGSAEPGDLAAGGKLKLAADTAAPANGPPMDRAELQAYATELSITWKQDSRHSARTGNFDIPLRNLSALANSALRGGRHANTPLGRAIRLAAPKGEPPKCLPRHRDGFLKSKAKWAQAAAGEARQQVALAATEPERSTAIAGMTFPTLVNMNEALLNHIEDVFRAGGDEEKADQARKALAGCVAEARQAIGDVFGKLRATAIHFRNDDYLQHFSPADRKWFGKMAAALENLGSEISKAPELAQFGRLVEMAAADPDTIVQELGPLLCGIRDSAQGEIDADAPAFTKKPVVKEKK